MANLEGDNSEAQAVESQILAMIESKTRMKAYTPGDVFADCFSFVSELCPHISEPHRRMAAGKLRKVLLGNHHLPPPDKADRIFPLVMKNNIGVSQKPRTLQQLYAQISQLGKCVHSKIHEARNELNRAEDGV